MAFCNSPSLLHPSSFLPRFPSNSNLIFLREKPPRSLSITMATKESDDNSGLRKPTKFVTFLGKGGSGKTTSAIFAAQHYAMAGLKTCLVIHSQDPTADYILNCKIGTTLTTLNNNLSAVRLETTKMLLDPLNRLKQADARLNMTQGVLEGMVGEELGVLPGMDSIFSAVALEKLVGFFKNGSERNNENEFDIVVYDGLSTEETIRMIGTASKSRLYLKYIRNLAEKTDMGRLAGPSLLRLADESVNRGTTSSSLNGKLSGEIWDKLESILEKGSSFITKPHLFGCYLVMDLNNLTSLNSALRYWGCAVQAGALVSGAFGIKTSIHGQEYVETAKKTFSPLPFAVYPPMSFGAPLNWDEIMNSGQSQDARDLLRLSKSESSKNLDSVIFDSANKSVTLFMPGFDKSEIKLYQYRGGSELLVEAGDQRRVIRLPSQIQGKVGGAKFSDRNLIVTMRN